jgi:hypothetical protein
VAAIKRVVLLCIALFGAVWLANFVQENMIAERILSEISLYDAKNLDMEAFFTNTGELREKLPALNFSIAALSKGIEENYHLMGGRYCAIDGQLGAQLRLMSAETGEALNLYVVCATEELSRFAERIEAEDNDHLKIWQECGLFLALSKSNVPN